MRFTSIGIREVLVRLLALLALLTVARLLQGQSNSGQPALPTHETENVIVVMLDGLRCQGGNPQVPITERVVFGWSVVGY
jgi:hypothetical protein